MMQIPLLYLVLTVVVFPGLVVQSIMGAKASTGFSVELIHRDSPSSPFYDASLTSSEILRKNALRSMDRLKYFKSLIDESGIQTEVTPSQTEIEYLMKLSFGTPAVEYFAIADTGSNLIWIQCVPCPQCYIDQGSPLFDPQASSTYQTLGCDTESCQALSSDERQCSNDTDDCQYLYAYADKTFTTGTLSSDSLSFEDSNTAFPASIFGCAHNNTGILSVGLVGLGGGPLSLVSQISTQIDNRFSYCFAANSSTKLLFGQEAIISRPGAVSTPMISKDPVTVYYLTLEGVSIRENTAQADSSQGNIIIDSGTTVTILESYLYDSLESLVKDAIGAAPIQHPPFNYSLCYRADTEVKSIPEMVFHFSGADVRLQLINTFDLVEDNVVCMQIVPSDSISIFGNYAQINFQVEYDLQNRTVSFAPTNCANQ